MASPAAPGSSAQLTRLSRIVYRRADERLLGMKIKEYVSLIYLRDHLGTSQQALAEALHLDANNCVLLLNELEDLGFAERLRDKRDRRRHIVCLTPRGQSALELAERYMESVEDDVLGALTGQERAMLRELLTRALEAQDATSDRHVYPAGNPEKRTSPDL